MVLKATVYKASLSVADMNRQVYLNHSVTLAKHPPETEQHLMLRLIAWTLYADERLQFTKSICDKSKPELWIQNYSNEIELWVTLGLPDSKRIKKACSQAKQVILFTYGDDAAATWRSQLLNKLHPFKNLTVINIMDKVLLAAAAFSNRNMVIQATIEDGQVWFSVGETVLLIQPDIWKISNA
ncbi:YaeQ family protein [Candidatus Enterovibrio altilux]|uniref:YaeQ family protein n=1 Tax=Candidatus Enterovibrio altilux TaxID=1927128 RepID=UPI001237ABD9|nr:YaeQ family protein [Candidatus Enterovibrio luxaltus]